MAKSFVIDTDGGTAIITTSEAKEHLKVDTTADDTLIGNLITAAVQSAQIFTNRFFIESQIIQYGDKWEDISYLFKSKVNQVSSIKYYDKDNSLQTLSTDIWLADINHQPARIGLKPDKDFPQLAHRINAIEVTYKVGYGVAGDVPQGIKQAVLLTIGNWYQNREQVVVGRIATELPKSAQYLLEQYKVQTIAL
tara:strand:+ start:1225 stop:1806 length:582 start_codon:yes stop_codon:yes gene_type:complete